MRTNSNLVALGLLLLHVLLEARGSLDGLAGIIKVLLGLRVACVSHATSTDLVEHDHRGALGHLRDLEGHGADEGSDQKGEDGREVHF